MIPQNSIQASRIWLSKRGELLLAYRVITSGDLMRLSRARTDPSLAVAKNVQVGDVGRIHCEEFRMFPPGCFKSTIIKSER